MAVVIKPLITEKMTMLSEKLSQYGFMVNKKATKNQIKSEIEDIYGVNVVRVNTMIVMGKRSSRFTKSGIQNGKKPNYKKAIITLKEGQEIDFFENI